MQRNNEKNKRKKEKLLEIQETVPEVEKKERILYIAHFLWILYYKTRIHNILWLIENSLPV